MSASRNKITTGNADVEQQLADLHRKYRIMEGNRKSYSEDSQNIIKRQRAAIEKLKQDSAALKEELAMESKDDLAPASMSVQQQISKLQDLADTYTKKIELEKRRVEELEAQTSMCVAKAMDQRRMMGGINAAKENNQQVSKQVKVLENRLDKALIKFNEALSANRALREEIDNLRRERVVFDQIYKKLERELHEMKKEMANVIEISNIAYEARDQAQNEMAALRAQADKEQAAFEAEWRELGKLIEADKKMKDIMKKDSKSPHRYGEMSMEDEVKLRKKVIKGNWGIAKDKAGGQVSVDKVHSYEEAFASIKAATGISDIDKLVTSFIDAEDQNFSLYHYVSELNTELEKLEEQVAELHSEIERYKGAGDSDDATRKKILQDLEERFTATEAKSVGFENRYASAMRTIAALKTGVNSIYQKIGCAGTKTTGTGVKALLGQDGPNEQNMLQYLGLIEGRANEVLQMYASSQLTQATAVMVDSAAPGTDAGRPALLGSGPQTAPGASTLAIEPPSTADEYASDEESEEEQDDRPLTVAELQAKTLRNLNKREARGSRLSRHQRQRR